MQPAVETLLASMSEKFAALESNLNPASASYSDILPEVRHGVALVNTLQQPTLTRSSQLERIREPISYAWGVAGHLNGVKNGDELRKAYEESQPKVIKAFTEFKQSRVLYDSMKNVLESEKAHLSQEQVRALESSVHAMQLGGVGLDGEEKERFNEIKQRLAELSTTFSNNVLDATKMFSLEITDPADVGGVPESAKKMWAAAAEGDSEKGPWKITLDGPSYISAMHHLGVREHREKLYRAFVTRASEGSGDKNNVPLISEILSLKLEMSKLIGFNNYAEQSLSSKMADNVAAVDEMSSFMKEKALPAAVRELQEITDFTRANGGEEYSEAHIPKLMSWDTTYWSERLKENKFSITEEEVRYIIYLFPSFPPTPRAHILGGRVTPYARLSIKCADSKIVALDE